MPFSARVRPGFRESRRSRGLTSAVVTAAEYYVIYAFAFCKRKKRDRRESLPQADASEVAFDIARAEECPVSRSQDVATSNGCALPPGGTTAAPETDNTHIRKEIAGPEEKTIPQKVDGKFVKWVSIFKGPGSEEFVNRKVQLDSGSNMGLNIISEDALENIECTERTPNGGVKICGLFNCVFRSKETVKLRFRFWDRLKEDESFEEKFLVLPKFGFGRPGFDMLLCADWMLNHQSAWVPQLKEGLNERS